MKALFVLLVCSVLICGISWTRAGSSWYERFYVHLKLMLLRHYPKATSRLVQDKIHMEHNTRIFVVHIPDKLGKWQDPVEERGPEKGGILAEIDLRKGKYMGAAVVPQTFDRHYYKVLLLAPYSEKHDCHLYVHLYYPTDASMEFLEDFTAAIKKFENIANGGT